MIESYQLRDVLHQGPVEVPDDDSDDGGNVLVDAGAPSDASQGYAESDDDDDEFDHGAATRVADLHQKHTASDNDAHMTDADGAGA